jgi:hypothetical protein
MRWRTPERARPPPTAKTPTRRNQAGEAKPERLGALGADGGHVPDHDHAERDHVVREDVERPPDHRADQQNDAARLRVRPEVDGHRHARDRQEQARRQGDREPPADLRALRTPG